MTPVGFIEDPRFPLCISTGSVGGPVWRTTLVPLESGHEQRNRHWAHPRYQFDAQLGIRNAEDFEQLTALFNVAAGRAYGFRFRDPKDHKTCTIRDTPAATDQVLGTGDGALTAFQLSKRYTFGAYEYARPIRKPVASSVLVAIDGAPTTAFTLAADTGMVTFTAAPGAGQALSWGGEFDVPVRFDIDQLAHSYEGYLSGSGEVPLVELRGDTP